MVAMAVGLVERRHEQAEARRGGWVRRRRGR